LSVALIEITKAVASAYMATTWLEAACSSYQPNTAADVG